MFRHQFNVHFANVGMRRTGWRLTTDFGGSLDFAKSGICASLTLVLSATSVGLGSKRPFSAACMFGRSGPKQAFTVKLFSFAPNRSLGHARRSGNHVVFSKQRNLRYQ
ncbi:hypothetical protein [Ruegeria sp. HKCCA5763]|uniref:hypothetical protein n=1 Tax=Ruegeria sp. HKCCA5763 TaxID=2682987 RepID=UPI001487D0B4|nr:hypothetical protein [Ruegeria sp. HKCCA5763]